MSEICISDAPQRMVVTNHSVRSDPDPFDGVIVPDNPDRVYLELWGPQTTTQSSVSFTFGEPWAATKPSFTLTQGQRVVFDKSIPMGDIYAHFNAALSVGAFEGVPYEET